MWRVARAERRSVVTTLNIHLIRFIAESDRSAVAVDVVIVRRVSRIVACKDTAQCL